MTHTLTYPETAVHDAAGHLVIDGCDLVDLAREFGTPLFVYEEKGVRNQCRRFVEAFAKRTDDFEVVYASKAFPAVGIAQLITEEGLSIDVSSGGEYHTALVAGVPTDRMFFHGNNKTPAELAYALDNGIGFVVADSFDELELLERLVAQRNGRQRILLRITPGIEAHTHEYIQTGQEDSKFGFGLVQGLAIEAIKRAMAAPHLELLGLHAHIGSQIFELDAYRATIGLLADLLRQAADELGFACRYLNVGGGLGVRYTAQDDPVSIDEYAEVEVTGLREEMARVGLPVPRILVEPGRSIVATSGVTAYTVGTIKHLPGIRTFVSVDGGMSDNIRPMLYQAKYEVGLANRMDEPADATVTVVGKHCESSDVLVRDVLLPLPRVGDTLVIPATGAYCYAMASNYNGNPRPAVLLVNDGVARVLIERETYADLVAKHHRLED